MTTCERQVYFVAGKAVELWENALQPFGWSEVDLDGYARNGRWDLLFNALVLAHALDGTAGADGRCLVGAVAPVGGSR